jgi:hypothetical protein
MLVLWYEARLNVYFLDELYVPVRVSQSNANIRRNME